MFILLLLLCCCNKDNNGCGCGYDKRNGDCCDLILWIMLLNCICGDKNGNHCCK